MTAVTKINGPVANLRGQRLRNQLAKTYNVSPRLVQMARTVLKKGVLELRELVETGEIRVSAAALVAEAKPKKEQKRLAALGAAEIKAAAAKIRTEQKNKPKRKPGPSQSALPPKTGTGTEPVATEPLNDPDDLPTPAPTTADDSVKTSAVTAPDDTTTASGPESTLNHDTVVRRLHQVFATCRVLGELTGEHNDAVTRLLEEMPAGEKEMLLTRAQELADAADTLVSMLET